jgi:integrase
VNRDRRVRKVNGKWGFVVDVPGPDGQRRQVRRQGFGTSRAANDALHELLDASRHGLPTDRRGGPTVEEYLTGQWLPSLEGRDLRATTLDSYRRAVHNHLVPHLGAIRLSTVDAVAIETMLGRLAAAGLSSKTRANVRGVLSKALTDAVRWKLTAMNPVATTEAPRAARPTPKVWTDAQLATFLRRGGGDRLAPLWRFLMVTGCRRGEAVGLRWTDVDLEHGHVVITSQRTMVAGIVVEGLTKTRSGARTVSLDQGTVALLRRWRRVQRAEHVRLGIRPAVGYVFTGEDGLPLWPDRVTRLFGKLCDSYGLPRIRVHGLRHSAATSLIAAGVNPKVVSQRLGHATPGITLSLYSHVLPAHDQAAAEAFGALLDAQSESECDIDVTPEPVDLAAAQRIRGS